MKYASTPNKIRTNKIIKIGTNLEVFIFSFFLKNTPQFGQKALPSSAG